MLVPSAGDVSYCTPCGRRSPRPRFEDSHSGKCQGREDGAVLCPPLLLTAGTRGRDPHPCRGMRVPPRPGVPPRRVAMPFFPASSPSALVLKRSRKYRQRVGAAGLQPRSAGSAGRARAAIRAKHMLSFLFLRINPGKYSPVSS